jgi:histidinol-phosphate aminotransferase
VIKLASNENPLGPSPRAVAALRRAAGEVFRYPDGFSTDLRSAVAKHVNFPVDQITLGAGSDEIIEILGKTYLNPGDDIVVSRHAFIRYKMAADLMGARTRSVPMRGFTHDLDAMARAVTRRTKLVFVANPNNPTGTYNTGREMEGFFKRLSAHVLPVFDEAYYEYARSRRDYRTALGWLKKGRTVMVLRTFSKIHGLAGVRLGYGAGPKEVVACLERVRPPFNVSVPAQTAGLAALGDPDHPLRSANLVERERKRIETTLTAWGVKWVPSAANFLLIETAPARGRDVFDALLKKGVIVRAMDEYEFPHHVRVTVGRPIENNLFLQAFREVRRIP